MAEPLRVLIVLDSLTSGGAERVAVELACALDRTRFAPTVVVTRHGGTLEGLLLAADVPVEILGRRRRLAIRPILRLHRLARNHDLIHSHKFGSNLWAALVSRTSRRPLITHEHNWAGPEGPVHRWLHRRWIGPRARRVIAVSDDVIEALAGFGVNRERLAMIPNGVVPVPTLARAQARLQLGLPESAPVAGIVALLRPVKAHDVLLRATALLLERGSVPPDFTMCAIGEGDELAHLQRLASELNITDHVVWAGFQLDAAQLLTAFDVSVLCSHSEGMPLAILESMSAGIPVVASAVGSIPTLLADGAGVAVVAGDPAALANGIEQVLSAGDDQRHAMTDRAARRIRQEYSHSKAVDRVQQLYDDVAPALPVAFVERGKRHQRAAS